MKAAETIIDAEKEKLEKLYKRKEKYPFERLEALMSYAIKATKKKRKSWQSSSPA